MPNVEPVIVLLLRDFIPEEHNHIRFHGIYNLRYASRVTIYFEQGLFSTNSIRIVSVDLCESL